MRRDTEAHDERALHGAEHTPLGIIRAFMRRVGWLPKPPPLEPAPREPGDDDDVNELTDPPHQAPRRPTTDGEGG